MKSLKWLAIGIGLVVLACFNSDPLQVTNIEIEYNEHGREDLDATAWVTFTGSGTVSFNWWHWGFDETQDDATQISSSNYRDIDTAGTYTICKYRKPSSYGWYQLRIWEYEYEFDTLFGKDKVQKKLSDSVFLGKSDSFPFPVDFAPEMI